MSDSKSFSEIMVAWRLKIFCGRSWAGSQELAPRCDRRRVGKVTLSTAVETRAEEYHSDRRSACTYDGIVRGGSKMGI